MALTLLESEKYANTLHAKGIYRVIAESSPVTEMLPFKRIDGSAWSYDRESVLPGVAFRAVNESYPRSTGVIASETERLVILGGDIFIDNFQLDLHSSKYDLKATQWEMKAKAAALTFSECFFEGDAAANFRQFDGLRNRLTGSQVITAGANGAALTLDMLDQALDTVIGDSGKVIWLNKILRRKLTTLGRNAGGGFSFLDTGTDSFGRQVMRYNGFRLNIVEREDTQATILDFDETQGSSNVTASIYIARLGENYVSGLVGGSSGPKVYQVAKETEAAPGNLGRIDWYVSMYIKHPRAAARIKGITNA